MEISPLFITSDKVRIPDNSTVALVVALPKFSLGKKKKLTIQLVEGNAQRQVELKMDSGDFTALEILNTL